MKICVFGAASAHIDEIYIKTVEELGEKLARRGHSLVFGAGGTGLMGAAARGFKRGGGYIYGVVPEFFRESGIEQLYDRCDKVVYTKTMRERKAEMENEAQAFIVVPGGVGTFEEMFEIITLKQLNRHDKCIAILNTEGYYDDLATFMNTACARRFINENCLNLYQSFSGVDELISYVENYKPDDTSWKKLKLGE